MLESLPFPDRLMAMIAAFCAMRPGEIFGLQWSSWRGDHFQIEGTAWRGRLRPGKAKTKGSKAPVTVPNLLVPLLQMWREQHAGASPDALIVYTQAIPESVRKLVNAVADDVMGSTPEPISGRIQ
jgi:integrase